MPRLKFFCEGLTPRLVKRAEIELGETPEVRKRTLNKIKSLIKDEPDFSPCTEDGFLMKFLRVQKFNVGKAFELLKRYYAFKAKNWGTITGFKPSDLEDLLAEEIGFVLEYRDDNDCGVGIYRVGSFDLNKFTPEQLLAHLLNGMEIGCLPEASNVAGYVIIEDLTGFSFAQMMRFAKPSIMRAYITMIQDCIPSRIKAFHTINAPAYHDILMKIAVMFLSKKFRQRIHFRGNNLNSLHKYVPLEILPEEYGGTQGTWSECAKKFASEILTYDDYIDKLNKYGYKGETLQKLRRK